MTDIVERLRARKAFFQNGGIWLMSNELDPEAQEAADEIESLRRARYAQAAEIDHLCKMLLESKDDIKQLRELYTNGWKNITFRTLEGKP